jgi:Ras-related GTP-binding protein C/D
MWLLMSLVSTGISTIVQGICNSFSTKDEGEGLAYDDETQSIIKLNNGMVLYLREVNK